MISRIKIGSRGSELALWQTHWVRDRLSTYFPGIAFEVVTMKTTGDRILDVPLADIGAKGLFTKELDQGLLSKRIDIAVHSLKDLPTVLPDGIDLGAVCERWDMRDALVSRDNRTIDNLPEGATVATGSLRRRAQLLSYRPDLKIVDIRGNLNTRFRKFDQSGWDAMILAVAGIERLGWQARIAEKISFDVMLPAVGQGSIAVTSRSGDAPVTIFLKDLEDSATRAAVTAERALLRALEGGCQVPIGALARAAGDMLRIDSCVCSLDGQKVVRDMATGPVVEAELIGTTLSEKLLELGAGAILEEVRKAEPLKR